MRDAATVLGVIAGHDVMDATSSPLPVPDFTAALDHGVKGMKLGVPAEYFAEGLDEEVRVAVLAQTGLGDMQSGGGTAEVQLLGHRHEITQMPDLHRGDDKSYDSTFFRETLSGSDASALERFRYDCLPLGRMLRIRIICINGAAIAEPIACGTRSWKAAPPVTMEDGLWGQLLCDALERHGYGGGRYCRSPEWWRWRSWRRASSSSSTATGKTPVKGGTAVFAEPPSSPPDYILPFMAPPDVSNVNLFDFTYLMYRPLYWFGTGVQPTLNTSLSLASAPVFSGRNVTIKLNNYKWSNGSPVTAQDVMFWINMDRAVPQDWFDYSPGAFPANVSNIKVVSSNELTMTLKKTYSSYWFLYNELSQITPMPAAWDRTASGPSNCDTTVSDCAAVYSYLAAQAKDLDTYATNPTWAIVDGPWKLSAFNADGHITFVPNKSYSGPVKPKLAAFQEVPFTTDAAEYDVLQSPSSSTKIDVGYLPTEDAPAKPANAAVGTNPLASKGYTLAPLYTWGFDFYVMNFQATDGNGPVLRQLYIRQALAYLTNQKAIIEGPMRGYGAPTVGPVGSTPVSKFLSPQGKAETSSKRVRTRSASRRPRRC